MHKLGGGSSGGRVDQPEKLQRFLRALINKLSILVRIRLSKSQAVKDQKQTKAMTILSYETYTYLKRLC